MNGNRKKAGAMPELPSEKSFKDSLRKFKPAPPKPAPPVLVAPGSAVAPVIYERDAKIDLPPFDRFDKLAAFLEGNTHCYTPAVLDELKTMVGDYERLLGDNRSSAFVPKKKATPADADGRERMGDAEIAAREKLKQAGYQFADAIRAYEEAAVALMAVDFNRGLTVAQWAKALRVRQQEQQLEGA